jgi:hypothetical protein
MVTLLRLTGVTGAGKMLSRFEIVATGLEREQQLKGASAITRAAYGTVGHSDHAG